MDDDKVLIALEYLKEGIEVPDDVYNFNGKVKLLEAGMILTGNHIQRIKKYNNGKHNIVVGKKTFDIFFDGIEELSNFQDESIEAKLKYEMLATGVDSMIEQVMKDGEVEHEVAQDITQQLLQSMASSDVGDILQLVNTPRPMDEDLQSHCLNVSIISGLIGEWLGMGSEEIEILSMAGLVHDVGKTKIPIEILNAPRKLTEEEFSTMKKHTNYSFELLSEKNEFASEVILAARHHHENINGGGYPDNLAGNEIPFEARIVAVADVYDAMVAKRSYKEANNPFKIIERFEEKHFVQLDPEILEVFIRNMPLQYIGKEVLLSDGTVGVIKHVIPNDVAYPIVDVDGVIKQVTDECNCVHIISRDGPSH